MTASLYRKYRPQTFGEVVGQDAIARTLRNAIAQDKVSHAYLFCGPRGTGKTTTARLMSKALLCENGPTPDPDGTCEECRLIAEGAHPDVYELDAASRTGVENVREEIIGRVNFAPTRGRSKVYIIDEVHMLSVAAFNALLKTLEEPPSHVVFILCTTDPQRVPATIHSRCQRFDFHRISVDQIVSRLGAVCVAEDVSFEPEALDLIASRSDGGMRNALTTLEQLMVFGEGHVTLASAESLLGTLDSGDMARVVEAIGRRDAKECFSWVSDYVDSGADLAQFAKDLTKHVRDLYVLSVVGEDAPVELSDEERKLCERELPFFGVDRLSRLMGILGELQNEMRFSHNPRLSFEISLTRMIRPDGDLTMEALAERVATLEKALGAKRTIAVDPVSASVAPTDGGGASAASAPASESSCQAAFPARPAAPVYEPPAAPAMPTAPAQVSDVPASGSSAASDGLVDLSNPAALQRAWQSVVSLMKREKAAYGVFFLNTVVSAVPGGPITVKYPAGSTFAYEAACKPDVQEALAGCVQRVFNAPIPVECVMDGGAPSVRIDAPAPRNAPAVPVPPVPPMQKPSTPVPARPDVPAKPIAPARSAVPAYESPVTPTRPSVPAAPAQPAAPAYNPPAAPASASAPVDDIPLRAPSRRPMATGPDFDYDQVPLDAYDGMAPSDYDSPVADASDYSAPAANIPNRDVSTESASGSGEENVQDIQNLLSSSFGNEIIFEEIQDE